MPVHLEQHDPRWAAAVATEAAAIGTALCDLSHDLHHIGSTAVPGLLAKPILDLLLGVDDLDELAVHTPALEGLGYEAMGAYGIAGRLYFRKFDGAGARTHHIHAFARGSHHLIRHLAFRDYLCAHPEVAQAYGALKSDLVARSTGPEAYMDGKDAFVLATEADALAWWATRRA